MKVRGRITEVKPDGPGDEAKELSWRKEPEDGAPPGCATAATLTAIFPDGGAPPGDV